jgi:ectoine hydrolase
METRPKPLWEDLPQLPLSERDRRWGNVRQQMESQGIDCLVVWSTGRREHTRYLSQLANNAAVVFPLRDEPVVFTDGLTASAYAGESTTWVSDVRQDMEHLPEYLRERGLDGATIGVVSSRSPHTRLGHDTSPYRGSWLQAAVPNAELVNATAILEQLEMVKSPPEIEFLQRAAGIAYDVFTAMANTAHPGATESEVYASMLA